MYQDVEAVLGLPISLIVALIVTSIVLGGFALSIFHVMHDSQTLQIEAELQKIRTKAQNMYEYADEGSRTIVPVSFPGSMHFLVFGGLPKNTTDFPYNLSLDEQTSNNYYYVMNDGFVAVYHSNVRFSGNTTNTIAVFRPGTHYLSLELVTMEGKTYVTISE